MFGAFLRDQLPVIPEEIQELNAENIDKATDVPFLSHAEFPWR